MHNRLLKSISSSTIALIAAFILSIPNIEVEAASGSYQQTFSYTGSEQTFTAPEEGYYEFDVYGAQGGSYGSYSGGLGGNVKTVLYLNKDQTVYINVGGQGTTSAGGYNGGGAPSGTTKYTGGGGATSVATVSGQLSTLSSDTANILLVAGGGGGATAFKNGGAGGVKLTEFVSGFGLGQDGSAGGGAGETGGKAGVVMYHTHKSSCYKTETYSYIPSDPWNNCDDTTNLGGDWQSGNARYRCNCCHSEFTGSNGWHHCSGSKHYTTGTRTVLNCGKTTSTVDTSTSSSGGNNSINYSNSIILVQNI